jgi:hypothetical protein
VGKLDGNAVASEVPLPYKIPVILVLIVIAGVVVAVATVPEKPLVDTIDIEVTVPEVTGAIHAGIPPPETVRI